MNLRVPPRRGEWLTPIAPADGRVPVTLSVDAALAAGATETAHVRGRGYISKLSLYLAVGTSMTLVAGATTVRSVDTSVLGAAFAGDEDVGFSFSGEVTLTVRNNGTATLPVRCFASLVMG